MTETIKTSYLMWVGSEHYPTINDWAAEAVNHGISKRLPGASVGEKLLEPGSVIFVAHDEGEYADCPECTGTIECPECRKAEQEAQRVQAEIDALLKPFDGDRDAFLDKAARGKVRSLEVREAKLEKLADAQVECELCGGEGALEAGTGGTVSMEDGSTMDYRTYNYWLHQPAKFDPESVEERDMCDHCGGTGKLPDAKVFGMFLPEDIEYIVAGDEDEKAMEKVKSFTKVDKAATVREVKRGCGYRRERGVYAVTSTDGDSTKAKKALAELVKAGVVNPEATEVKGSFVRFIEPISIDVKRFRGIKSWSLSVDAEEAAEDILEALA